MLYEDKPADRQKIIDTCLKMNAMGINQGTSGNVSLKTKEGMLISPSGVAYEALMSDDIVYMDNDEKSTTKPGRVASTEWRFHLDILKARDDANAVVHTHSIYATILAIAGLNIPAVHYMIAASGGEEIVCAPYATYGTRELSENAIKALVGRQCCLLSNHGVIAIGATIEKALWLAKEVEVLSQQYVFGMTLGKMNILPKDEIDRVVEKFKDYGLKS